MGYQATPKSLITVQAISFIQQHWLEETAVSHNNQNVHVIFLPFVKEALNFHHKTYRANRALIVATV